MWTVRGICEWNIVICIMAVMFTYMYASVVNKLNTTAYLQSSCCFMISCCWPTGSPINDEPNWAVAVHANLKQRNNEFVKSPINPFFEFKFYMPPTFSGRIYCNITKNIHTCRNSFSVTKFSNTKCFNPLQFISIPKSPPTNPLRSGLPPLF